MMVGVLRASSDYAKANGAASGPDIFLLQEVTHIGRNVPKTSGLPLPMTLAQVSGKHCQVIGNPHLGYQVHDTSTNGSYIIRGDQTVVRVPKGGALPLATGDILRLSTVSNNSPSTVLEYRLEIVAEETRVRKSDDAAEGDDATPVKRLCMSNVSGTADKEAEMAQERKLNQLLATNKDLQLKLGEARSDSEATRKQLDDKAAEAHCLAAELKAAHVQGKAAVAAAAADAAQHCEQQIKELSAAKASLMHQVEQGQQAFRAQEEATASLTRDLEAQQAEVQQLKQHLTDAQQHKDNDLQALEASKSGLQEQLAAVITEAEQLREQLSSTAQEMQELRGQADTAGQAQQQADEQLAVLRQQLVSSQREALDATTKMGDMQISLQVLRDELAVNEERFSRQLQQWRKVAEAQRRVQEAQSVARTAERDMAAAVSTLGKAVLVNEEKAVIAQDQTVNRPADSDAAQFDGTQHTLEVSSHNPAPSHNPAAGTMAAGTQAASSAPIPTAAAAAKPAQQPDMADAPTAPLEDTTMQQSAPDAGTELHAAEPVPIPAGSTAEAYEPGQKVDTMGRLTGPSAPDTQANGGANGSQSANSGELEDNADEAGADAAGDSTAAGAVAPVPSADPPSSSKPAGAADAQGRDDESDEDGDAAAKPADSDGDLMANGTGGGKDDDEDAEMEEAAMEEAEEQGEQ